MVDAFIGCCATIQKWLIFFVNFILFIFGVVQMGFGAYVLAAGSDSLGFAAEVLDGNDTIVYAMLVFGAIILIISLQGCIGAKRESKFLLWIYAVILFFLIMGQAMTVALVAVSVEYGDSIFETFWKQFDAATIDDVEQTYQCCSFNGDPANANDTWAADVTDYDECSSVNSFDPMETCWDKFSGTIYGNYESILIILAIFLGVQIVIYFCVQYVIQSIAKAEGRVSGKEIEFQTPNV